ncbi:phosphoglycerate kinase [Flavobacteriales bacterium]|nr:phosphoglycerate kinase [Flavobacteriales bacterium]
MNNIANFDFKNKRTLIRVDFNVPLTEDNKVTDNSRIIAAIPTIKKVISAGGIAILISHLGRPKGKKTSKHSLSNIQKDLEKLLLQPVAFLDDCIGSKVESFINKQNAGSVIVLENLRFYNEEEIGDISFAKKLANLADVYINDAFGTAHRQHASNSVITQFFKTKFFGLLMQDEIFNLDKAIKNPSKPFTAIIGGAKISGKIEIVLSLIEKVDNLIIGGGMAYTFVKARGGAIGNSIYEKDKLDLADQIIQKAQDRGVNIILPTDSVNSSKFGEDGAIQTSDIEKISPNYMGLDIGPKSIQLFKNVIQNSKTIIWNGPMGVFEMDLFSKGTEQIALSVSKATSNGAYSLVGGGDSVSAIKKFNLENNVSYISTGGGAMIEYLEGKKLPAIEAML